MMRAGVAGQATGIVQLMRPETSLPAALYTFLGIYLATATGPYVERKTVLAALTVTLIVAFGFVINDYQDGDADRVDKPNRPIPSGRISRRTALIVAIALVVVSQAIAWRALGPGLALFAVAATALTAAYSFFLKSTVLLGNLTIAVLDSSILLYGGLVAGNLPAAVWIATLLVLIYVLAQEVFYTVEDVRGDREAGVRTVATAFGVNKAVRIFQLLAVIFAIAAIAPWYFGMASSQYLWAVILCAVAPLLGTAAMMAVETSERTVRTAVRVIYVVWFLSVIPVVLLKQ
jgi:geranylgeranylglycerol-phosphate geranylgeranyltransferase